MKLAAHANPSLPELSCDLPTTVLNHTSEQNSTVSGRIPMANTEEDYEEENYPWGWLPAEQHLIVS